MWGRSGGRVLSCARGSTSTSARHVPHLLGTGYTISKGQVGKQTRGTDLAKATGWVRADGAAPHQWQVSPRGHFREKAIMASALELKLRPLRRENGAGPTPGTH